MRRTYRSKKNAGDALDHKDVLLTMDEKSSAFDAFYIQNIKQTKREMSSVNFLAAPPSKVRKRKYVKRIIKDPEPRKESLLDSVYLTPNKSLRVNKPLDPFDQLLNSSSTHHNDSLRVNKAGLLGCQNEAKTYRKKRVAKVKKYNYSSSDTTDSEKENYHNSKTPDKSNIKKHELLVERNTKSPLCLDKSIKDLVQNFSLLKKASPRIQRKVSSPLTFIKNRLTTYIQSPILQNSPLCSTPFKEKYRGESIYNFSPISTKVLDDSVDINSSQNNSNESIILVTKKNQNISKQQDISPNAEVFKSPVFKTPDIHKAPAISVEDCKEDLTTINNNNDPLCENYPQMCLDAEEITDDKVTSNVQDHSIALAEINKSDDKVKSSIEISSLQTTELEPFIGFINNEPDLKCHCDDKTDTMIQKGENNSIIIHEAVNDQELNTEKETNNYDNNHYIPNSSVNIIDMKNDSVSSQGINNSLEHSIMLFSNDNPVDIDEENDMSNLTEAENVNNSVMVAELLQDTEQDLNMSDEEKNTSRQSSNKSSDSNIDFEISQLQNKTKDQLSLSEVNVTSDDSENQSQDLVNQCQQSSNKSSDSSIEFEISQLQNKTKDQLLHSEDNLAENVASDNSEDQSQDLDNQSLYDTCDSGNTSQEDGEMYNCNKFPVVELERLNDSIFNKYYNKIEKCDTISQSSQGSDNYESLADISDQSCNELESNSENVSESNQSSSSRDTSDDNDADDDSNSNTDEDRCISFVTTRRRNEVTNDSMILGFNDSYGSVSSLECDKTVLSINRISNSDRTSNNNEATLVNSIKEIKAISEDIVKPNTTRLSNVVTRKSEKRVSLLKDDEVKNDYIECKPSIVLQPGKKWERSLSIFRRMTMMNDHFDHSLLEEPMNNKGRKYRQSVINTMEMQDKSILHNESLNSRRSTFVSKPCRSTIKIVKEPNNSRISLSATSDFDDLQGFLNEDCDDTIVGLSKLSIADSDHEVTVLENFHDAGRIATARDYVLRRCNQTEVLLFDECYPDTVLKNCHKIGEGVYGEVYLWRARDGRARVMKIVPIAGSTKVNGESQKDFHEIISEIVIAMELSALRAPIAEIDRHFDEGKDIDALDLHSVENATDVFNEVLAVRCVYGPYPSRLLDLWELYDECKGSENDSPATLPADQQYIVLELANAGQDLESYQFNSAEQAHALLLQVAYALAVGEESFQFEHRDLHWGNVLIAPTDQKFATFVLRGRAHRVPRCGVSATVIDYSLSRLSLPLPAGDRAALYNDLSADDGLFDALGDYQFEVYRRMRTRLGNDWKNFEPYTNILWLHYTVDKMITALRYKRTNTKIHKHYIAKLKGIKNRILDYGSAVQFVLTDNEL